MTGPGRRGYRVVEPRFGHALRELRQRHGLSLRELAGAVYYSKTHMAQLESGVRRPTFELARRLDTVLGAGGELAAMVPAPPALPQLCPTCGGAR